MPTCSCWICKRYENFVNQCAKRLGLPENSKAAAVFREIALLRNSKLAADRAVFIAGWEAGYEAGLERKE